MKENGKLLAEEDSLSITLIVVERITEHSKLLMFKVNI